jgi:hypothetical protein
MTIIDLTAQQLRRAAAIKEQIERLNRELRNLLADLRVHGTSPRRKRTMSATVRRKIAAVQKTRWAKRRRA